MAKFVEIGGKEYNKTGYGKFWKNVVAKYEIGVELSGEDMQFFLDSCNRLERYRKVMLRGDVRFRVVNKTFNGRRVKGVVMVTPNSKFEVWVSKEKVMGVLFPKAFLPDPQKVNRKNVLKALRGIIDPQIKQFKRGLKSLTVIKSASSGKPILGPYHVDHVYPFIRLAEEWCRENGYDLERIEVKCRGSVCTLADTAMAESWFDYHMINAKLQVLDAAENTSKGSKYFG